MAYKDTLLPEPLDDDQKKEKKEILNKRISTCQF